MLHNQAFQTVVGFMCNIITTTLTYAGKYIFCYYNYVKIINITTFLTVTQYFLINY